MGFSEANIVSKIALIVLPVGELFIMIGLATKFWFSATIPSSGVVIASFGLWEYCSLDTCAMYEQVAGWEKATRTFVILGMLFAAAGIGLFVLSILKSDNKVLKMAAICPPFVAGMCIIIGIGVYAGNYLDLTTTQTREIVKLSWSFALTTVGGLISGISGIIWIAAIVMDRK